MNVVACHRTPNPIESAHIHSHRDWEIILNLSGTSTSIIDGNRYEIAANDIQVIPPDTPHGSEPNGGMFTDIYVQAVQLNFDSAFVTHDYDGSLGPLMNLIMKAISEHDTRYDEIADSLLNLMCLYISKFHTADYKYPFIADFKNLLFNNMSDPNFDIAECISNTGFSSDYFRRCFKFETGTTPVKYMNSLRMSEAKKLLSETYMSLQTIAMQCGFSDYFYFSRRFRHDIGITPSEYRNKYRN